MALKRLGYDVFLVDPSKFLPSNRWMGKWIYETGAWGLSEWVGYNVLNTVRNMRFDLVWVDHGQLLGPKLIDTLKKNFRYVVNWFMDNILYTASHRKWRTFFSGISHYDLIATPGKEHVKYMEDAGAKKVMRIFMSADDVIYKPLLLCPEDLIRWHSEVCFVGTWIPGRGAFLSHLLTRGVPISVWGDRWHKAKEWKFIKRAWCGPGQYNKNYIKIIQTSKICVGLLSEGDQHTGRSIEIPAVGSLLCAKRTEEHLQMYEEDKEAVFWKDADECADKCLELLASPAQIAKIASRGHERCLKNNYFNEPMLKKIISCATDKG